MADDDPLRDRWKLARNRARLSQDDAAKQLGVERGSISRVENGVVPVPPSYVLWAMVVWRTPPTLLGAADLGPAFPGDPLRVLEDLARRPQADEPPSTQEGRDAV